MKMKSVKENKMHDGKERQKPPTMGHPGEDLHRTPALAQPCPKPPTMGHPREDLHRTPDLAQPCPKFEMGSHSCCPQTRGMEETRT